jgi:hypothetical protein
MDARRPFREEDTSIDAERTTQTHAIEVRLLFGAFHPSGQIVLRPSAG